MIVAFESLHYRFSGEAACLRSYEALDARVYVGIVERRARALSRGHPA